MKKEIDYLKLAEETSKEYHEGQKRFDGSDYFLHLQGVADLMPEEAIGLKIVAWLHDILEDTSMTEKKLIEIGFDKELIKSVVIITREKDGNYLDYILRCSKDEIVREVKIADLTHNLSNLKKGSLRDKYLLALYILENLE